MNDLLFRRTVFTCIILAGALLYAKTISYPGFLFDGSLYLLNNPLVQDINYYARLFDLSEFSRLDEQLGLHPDVTTNFMLRPIAYLTFSINYWLSGFNASAFRAVNVTIHIFNSLLVFLIIESLLKFSLPGKSLTRFSARFIPTATALVFLLHPMQTEAVTYITQRFTSLAAMFYFMTIWLYLQWAWSERTGVKCGFVRWLAAGVLLLGMLTRESMITVPFLVVLLELTVIGNSLRDCLRRSAPLIMLLPIVPLMVLSVSIAQNGSSAPLSGAINLVNYDAVPALHYALTQVVVVVTYVRLYLLPYGQNVDPDPPLYTVPYQLPVIGAGLVIVFMVGGAFCLYRKNRADIRFVLVFVGVCWYFLALSVSSSFIPLPDLMAEHRAYVSSAGFIMVIICLIDLLRTERCSSRTAGLFLAGIAIWCAVLAVLTFKRNNMWQTGIHLWSDAVKKSPNKARPIFNLGVSYVAAGNFSEAQNCFQKTIEMEPGWGTAHEMLASSLLQQKRYQEAVEASLRGIMVAPESPVLYNNLGIAYAELDQYDNAKQAYSTALALLPGYEKAKINLETLESYLESNIGKRK